MPSSASCQSMKVWTATPPLRRRGRLRRPRWSKEPGGAHWNESAQPDRMFPVAEGIDMVQPSAKREGACRKESTPLGREIALRFAIDALTPADSSLRAFDLSNGLP